MKLFLVAGEASGDILGAGLMKELKALYGSDVSFYGLGGPRMQEQGLSSVFPMQEISLMGFFEIVPHLLNIYNRMKQLISRAVKIQPDVIITIDSPGFNLPFARRVKKLLPNAKLVHYVAPSVWAYKPGRAKKFAKIYDEILCLLPFEPKYFENLNVKAEFVGHPIVETKKDFTTQDCKNSFNLKPGQKLICLMPGSRGAEINRMLSIFIDALMLVKQQLDIKIGVPTLPHFKELIEKQLEGKFDYIVITDEVERHKLFAAADMGLVKSGTGSLEAALYEMPQLVAYKVNYLSYLLIKMMVKIKFANLVNIIKDRAIIPELLQNDCSAHIISDKLIELIQSPEQIAEQKLAMQKVMSLLGLGANETASKRAARIIKNIFDKNEKNTSQEI